MNMCATSTADRCCGAQVQTCRKNQFSSKMYSQTQHTGRGRFQKIGPKAAQEVVRRGIVSKIEQGTCKLNKGIMKSDCMHTYINSLYLVYLIYIYAPRSFLEEYEHQVQVHPGLNGSLMVNYGSSFIDLIIHKSLPKHGPLRFSQLFKGDTREQTRAHVASPPKPVVTVKEAAESLLTTREGSLHFLFLLFTFSLTPEAPTAPSISCLICAAAGLLLHRSCSMDCILSRR